MPNLALLGNFEPNGQLLSLRTSTMKPELDNQHKFVLTLLMIGWMHVGDTQRLGSLVNGVNTGYPFFEIKH